MMDAKLIQEVERVSGRHMETAQDFVWLKEQICCKGCSSVSLNTLKRQIHLIFPLTPPYILSFLFTVSNADKTVGVGQKRKSLHIPSDFYKRATTFV